LVHLAPRKEVPSGEPASYGPGAQALPGAVRNLPQIARGPPLTCPAAGADARPNGCCRYSCRGCRLWNTPALAPQTRRPLTPEGVQRGGPHAVRGPLSTASRFVPLLVGRGLGAQASRPLVFVCAFVHERCSVQALRAAISRQQRACLRLSSCNRRCRRSRNPRRMHPRLRVRCRRYCRSSRRHRLRDGSGGRCGR